MVRKAESLSFSVLPDDKLRWKRIEERRASGNRSQLLRHAMDLLEAEDALDRLAKLQDVGDIASVAAGIERSRATEAALAYLETPGYEPSSEARRIVAEVVGIPKPAPDRRRSGRVLEQLDEAVQAG